MASLRIQTGWPSKNLSPNGRPNRWQKASSVRKAKADGYTATLIAKPVGFKFRDGPLKVVIHASPPIRRLRDADNLAASVKSFLDGIAAALGVDDSRFESPVVRWLEPKPPGRLIFEVEGAAA